MPRKPGHFLEKVLDKIEIYDIIKVEKERGRKYGR